ncbi:MAG: D-sedoheptulose-7-phosphate isomerase [Planctomycetota bacterium]|jgi:D-sedoheptulose 7-phosphate isomerase
MESNVKKEIQSAIRTHRDMLDELESGGIETIVEAAEMITDSLRRGGCVYICGNGGSAADAQHIAGELTGRFRRDRTALSAVALSTNTSVITSIANDYGYENVFARQVEALVKKGDILWAISTSGSSANVILAAESAKSKGARLLALTGRAGSKLEKLADICLCADAETTFQSQQIHQVAYHIICGLVEKSFCK